MFKCNKDKKMKGHGLSTDSASTGLSYFKSGKCDQLGSSSAREKYKDVKWIMQLFQKKIEAILLPLFESSGLEIIYRVHWDLKNKVSIRGYCFYWKSTLSKECYCTL